ncbi:MAG: FAD-dependent oxidoreductase [Lachnospiraceae bacterium]|nr:FAD-dependent oxidoreductase [Lachnospiraceae bacterium]
MAIYDTIIIGGGPAGLAAAIYGKRAGLSLTVIERNPVCGGQVLNTYEVDNYPGLPGINGFDLGTKMKEHADKLEVSFTEKEAERITRTQLPEGDGFLVALEGGEELQSKTVILATGAQHAALKVPGEEEFSGRGVSYCATCDGNFFRGQETVVVGGGDVAVEDAIYLSRICSKVTLLHRRDALRATKVLQEELLGTENIEVRWNTVVREIRGEDRVKEILTENVLNGEQTVLPTAAVFVAVGIHPDTELVDGLAARDAGGYIEAGEDGATEVPGLFVAGDARKKRLRQIITAVADGANAATAVSDFIKN